MSGLAERLPRARLPRLPRRVRPARPLVVDGRPSPIARLYGLGTVYGKSLRDSRRGILLAGLGVGLIVFFTASQVAAEFGTAAARAAMAALPTQLPVIFRGMLGEPIDIEKLGAFISWRTLNIMAVILGTWSIATLSSQLASEASRGVLDLVVATPRGRASIALQKVAAHVTAVAVAMLVLGLVTWVSTIAFATLPGDEVALPDVLAHMVWLGLMTVFPGTVAWMLAPVLGRGAAAGIAGVVMLVSYVAHGYADTVPLFESLDAISYFGTTAGHRPIAGVYDWTSVGILALVGALFVGVGVLAFRARDIGSTVGGGIPLPRLRLGLGGPLGRSFADHLGISAWWGIGVGLFGLMFALNAESFADALRSIPQMGELVERFFPGIDVFSTGGVLQLVFFEVGTLIVVAYAAMVASGWAADEIERRLEFVLSAPLTRFGWGVRAGAGALLAVALFGSVLGGLLVLGTVAQGDDPSGPFSGALVLALYTGALVGVGIALGGLIRPTLAVATTASLGVATYLLDVFGSALRLPDELVDLALTNHLGQPMAGLYDPVGMAVCAVLAVGGVLLGALGLARRDVGR